MRQIRNSAWRSAEYTPSKNDHVREDAFFEQHIGTGALFHEVTAEALAAALESETDTSRRELFALRVFAEYVAALETMGAWGWAIRNRSKAPLLLDAFLSYDVADVRGFYEVVSTHDGELSSLLKLPPTEVITDAFRPHGIPHGPLLGDMLKLERNLKQASEHYFDPAGIVRHVLQQGEAWRADDPRPEARRGRVPAPIAPERAEGATERYAFYKFGSTQEDVVRTLKLIGWVSHSTQALVSFTRSLKTVGLLYGDDPAPSGER